MGGERAISNGPFYLVIRLTLFIQNKCIGILQNYVAIINTRQARCFPKEVSIVSVIINEVEIITLSRIIPKSYIVYTKIINAVVLEKHQ
jgi:hypothetical protein